GFPRRPAELVYDSARGPRTRRPGVDPGINQPSLRSRRIHRRLDGLQAPGGPGAGSAVARPPADWTRGNGITGYNRHSRRLGDFGSLATLFARNKGMFRPLQPRAAPYALLLAVAAGLCFLRLGGPSLWDVDEGHNAEAAREMFES